VSYSLTLVLTVHACIYHCCDDISRHGSITVCSITIKLQLHCFWANTITITLTNQDQLQLDQLQLQFHSLTSVTITVTYCLGSQDDMLNQTDHLLCYCVILLVLSKTCGVDPNHSDSH